MEHNPPIASLQLKPQDWQRLQAQLIQDHGQSVMITWVCCRTLGFSIRHAQWGSDGVWLDFFDEGSKAWFLLKHGDFK